MFASQTLTINGQKPDRNYFLQLFRKGRKYVQRAEGVGNARVGLTSGLSSLRSLREPAFDDYDEYDCKSLPACRSTEVQLPLHGT